MRIWRWYRARRWWVQVILGTAVVFAAFLALGLALPEPESTPKSEVRSSETPKPTSTPKPHEGKLSNTGDILLARGVLEAIMKRDTAALRVRCAMVEEIDDPRDHDRFADPCNDAGIRGDWIKAEREIREVLSTADGNAVSTRVAIDLSGPATYTAVASVVETQIAGSR